MTLASTAGDVEGAQRLRHRIFAGEMGARIGGRVAGRDEDAFDPWCEHLVVRDVATDEIVGTYRFLAADRARRLGAFCSESHFDLTRIARLKTGMVEFGRACVHPDYRSGHAIMLLWQGLARVVRERGFDALIGCASIAMTDGGVAAARIYEHIAPRHLAPIECRVRPRHPLQPREDADAHASDPFPALPPLLKGYLNAGAWIGGEPGWDPDFNTADLFVLLPIARIERRYARHFMRAAA